MIDDLQLIPSAVESLRAIKEKRPFTWDELHGFVPNVLNDIDLASGPCVSQSRLRLFGNPKESIRVTLYRDVHAWCPYCQKVWIWLEEKKIPYQVEKISMACYGQKETWYKKLVPNGMMPALKIDEHLYVESDDILEALETEFGVLTVSLNDPEALVLRQLERELFAQWCRWLCQPSRSKIDEKNRGASFKRVLSLVDDKLGTRNTGFFMDEFSSIDCCFLPFIERMAASLFYYKGFKVRDGEFKNISRWFDLLEERPAYRGTQSDFHTHCHDLPPQMGGCFETNEPEQMKCKNLVNGGPYFSVPDCHIKAPVDSSQLCLARVIRHKNSIMKQNPHRSGNIDEAFRCAMTFMITGVLILPPLDTASSLRYIRDRCCVPRDMSLHAARHFRHALDECARVLSSESGIPIPIKHRRDQEPFAFTLAKQES